MEDESSHPCEKRSGETSALVLHIPRIGPMEKQPLPASRTFNVPRPWSVTVLGTYHEHAVVLTILIALIPIGVIVVGRDHLHGFAELGLTVLALFLMAGGARHFVVAPVTRWVKPLVVGPLAVIYFRSFRQDQSYAARDMIAPILGCIGSLTTIHNPSYIQGLTGTEGHDQSEDAWFAWLELGEILSDGLAAITCEGDRWQQEVQHRLTTTDLAIIDVTVDSDNVAWELDQALIHLPKERVITICASGTEAATEMDCISYELSPKGRNRFRRALKQRLSAIRRLGDKVPPPE